MYIISWPLVNKSNRRFNICINIYNKIKLKDANKMFHDVIQSSVRSLLEHRAKLQ